MVLTSALALLISIPSQATGFFESFQNTELAYAVPMSKMFVGRMLTFSRKVLKGRGKRTRCPRQPIVTWMSTVGGPVMTRTTSLFVENSHPETLSRHVYRMLGSSSVWLLRYEPCLFIRLSIAKERCQSYFIDGCRHAKNRVNQPRLCASAHRGVPLYFCMARSYANFLVNYRLISPSSASSSVVMAKAILVAWSATLSSPDTISEKIMPASGEHSPLVRRSTCFFCSSRSFSST